MMLTAGEVIGRRAEQHAARDGVQPAKTPPPQRPSRRQRRERKRQEKEQVCGRGDVAGSQPGDCLGDQELHLVRDGKIVKRRAERGAQRGVFEIPAVVERGFDPRLKRDCVGFVAKRTREIGVPKPQTDSRRRQRQSRGDEIRDAAFEAFSCGNGRDWHRRMTPFSGWLRGAGRKPPAQAVLAPLANRLFWKCDPERAWIIS